MKSQHQTDNQPESNESELAYPAAASAPGLHEETAPDTTPQADAAEDKSAAAPWSRRRFLRTAWGGAIAMAAAACGRSRPTPTPMATSTATPNSPLQPTATASPVARSSLLPTPGNADHQTYLPFIEKDGEEVAVAPTDTPTPVDTPTPKPPPPTPTPQATAFPPGPASKLGLHVERNINDIFELLDTGAVPVVTTLELDANFAAQMKNSKSNPLIIGRIHVDQAQLGAMDDPAGAARAFVEQLLPYADDDRRRPYFDAWVSYNEPVANNAEEMQRLAAFEAERVRLLGDRGIRSIIGNFATGNPTDLALWEHFLPAVQAAQQYNGWLGLHEYAAPTIYYLTDPQKEGRYPGVSPQDEGWLTLRYRKAYNQYLKPAGLAIPLVFTECGVDGLVQPGQRPGPTDAQGWRDFQSYWAENGFGLWGPGAYIEQLVWYDEALRQDDYVIGGCIYALGTSGQWLSYDIQGPAAGVLKQYLSVHVS
ncbi:MAG: hypothetical protein H6641_23450 [Caldilineaceae bacterium]|nr:hypothetical protein [Caldilineaceae bacterium]